jgi:hypothetical protein
MGRKALVAALAGIAAVLSIAPLSAQQGQIRITSPTAGSTVTGPVNVTVDITGVTVKPAAEGDPNAFHYHVLVDVDPATVVQAGQPLPTGQENIIHTADLSVPLANLAPGPHTVTVILTRTDHVPLAQAVQDRVQFTVGATGGAQPQTGAAAPAAGTAPAQAPRVGAGPARRGDPLPLWAPALAVAALAGGLLIARRRGV